MSERISFIVPVYNTRPYLKTCVDSLLAQTLRDIGVILVDDGSPDGAGELCDRLAETDPRVRVIHQPNGGLSAARNRGIEAAGGEWLAFIDSDDWCEKDFAEALLAAAEKDGSDIAVCGWISEFERDGVPVASEENLPEAGVFEPRRILAGLSLPGGVLFVTACNRLVNRRLFEGLTFPEGKLHEDEFTAHLIYDRATRVSVVGRALYHYRQRADSITGSRGSIRHFDGAQALLERCGYYRSKNYTDLLPDSVRGFAGCFITALRDLESVGEEEKRRISKIRSAALTLPKEELALLSAQERLALKHPLLWKKLFGIKQVLKGRRKA